MPSRSNLASDPMAQTPMEQLLAEIWIEVLGLEQVGVHDSFLELGGSSLTMVQVMSMLEQRTGVKVNLTAFSHQTLGQLAVLCEERIAQEQAKRSGLWNRIRRLISGRGPSAV